jgi:hypothetical protein
VGSFDNITWQALTLILTLAGLVGTVAFWRLRGPVAGLRMLAVTLLPAAAYLTGTLRLIWEIGDAFVSWATRLAFSPMVWLGVILAATSVALFFLAGVLRRRGVAQAPKGSAQALPGKTTQRPAKPVGTAGTAAGDDDMADIEAILKRHGIS